MSNRTYHQYCAIARALDVVGDRWVLLIVRELLGGPKRYVDLQAGLPGIATDMLANRLRTLEGDGLVVRRTLPPPAGSKVYELTARGHDLAPILHELARFGMPLLGPRSRDEDFRIEWLANLLPVMFDGDRAGDLELTVQFDVGRDTLHAVITGGAIAVALGPAPEPDVLVTAGVATLARVAAEPGLLGDLVATGKLKVAGADAAIERLLAAFTLRNS